MQSTDLRSGPRTGRKDDGPAPLSTAMIVRSPVSSSRIRVRGDAAPARKQYSVSTPHTTISAMHTSPVCLVIRGWGPDGTPEPKVLLSWGSEGVRSPCWSEFERPFLQAGYRVVQGLQLSSVGQGSSRAL